MPSPMADDEVTDAACETSQPVVSPLTGGGTKHRCDQSTAIVSQTRSPGARIH